MYNNSLIVRLFLRIKQSCFYLQVFKRWPALMKFCQRNLYPLNMRRFCSWCSSKLSTYSRLLLKVNQRKTLSSNNWTKGNFFDVKFYKMFPHNGGFARTHKSWLLCFWTIFFWVISKRLTLFCTLSKNQGENWNLELRYIGESCCICSF